MYSQVNVSGTSTAHKITGLHPFTYYTCTLHATTVLNGPVTNPVSVRTEEQGTRILYTVYY